MDRTASSSERFWGRFRVAVLTVGTAIACVVLARQQVTNDAYYMLVRGWLFATGEWWVPFGLHTSAGGLSPGGLVAVLVGVPLSIWRDFRSPAVLLLLCHLAAYLVLDRSLRDLLGVRGRALFAVLCWLNPWHLYSSGWLWNVNWLFPLGMLHLATVAASRQSPRFWASLVHVLVIFAAMQMHMSFAVLVLISAGLFAGGLVRVHWPGAVVGGVLGALSLIPWALEALEHPEVLPGGNGFPLRGLLLVHPLLRGVGYLLRYPSFYYNRSDSQLDFTDALGPAADAVLGPTLTAAIRGIGPLTVLVPIAAQWWLWRRCGVGYGRWAGGTSREWLIGCCRVALLACLLAFALSPTTVMWWQAVVALPYIVMPVALWAEWQLDCRPQGALRAVVAWSLLTAMMALAFALAAPLCRSGGREADPLQVQQVEPFLEALGVPERVLIVPDPVDGPASALLRSGRRWFEDEDWLRRGKM